MQSYGRYARSLVILSILVAFSLGAVVASNATTNAAKITKVNYLGGDQWVQIANGGAGTVDLTGWSIANVGKQTYSFPAKFTLKAGAMVKVHSGKGTSTSKDLYNSLLVWNTKSDTATLKDASGKTVSEYKYPAKP